MTQYIIRRLLQMIPITLGILTLIFSLIHLIPGDPAVQIAGEGARPQDVLQVRKALEWGAELIFVWGGDGMAQRSIDALEGDGAVEHGVGT